MFGSFLSSFEVSVVTQTPSFPSGGGSNRLIFIITVIRLLIPSSADPSFFFGCFPLLSFLARHEQQDAVFVCECQHHRLFTGEVSPGRSSPKIKVNGCKLSKCNVKFKKAVKKNGTCGTSDINRWGKIFVFYFLVVNVCSCSHSITNLCHRGKKVCDL